MYIHVNARHHARENRGQGRRLGLVFRFAFILLRQNERLAPFAGAMLNLNVASNWS